MVLGSILNPVNSSMLAVALIPIGIAFGAPPAETAWLVSGLYLATATGQPVVGKLVDRYGARRLHLFGSALVGLAGLLGALAPSLGVLILARVLLGLGTCAGYPAAMYLIRSEARRTGIDSPASVLTLLSVSAQTIVVVGPTLGGLLIGAGGWRTVFAINIPIALATFVLGFIHLPRSRPEPTRASFDIPGIGLFAGTLTALVLFLMSPAVTHLWMLGLAVAAGVLFAVREMRVADPFIDLRVFGGNGPLIATYVRALLAQTIAYAVIYGFTQWLEAGRGLSASHAGLILLPMSLVAIGVSTATGRRAGFRAKLVVGAVAQIVAASLMLILNGHSPIWITVLISLICGLPQGLHSLANQNAVYYQADPARMGASAGLLRTFSYLGAMVASAAYGAFFRDGADSAGLHEVGVFLIVVAVLLLILILADRSLSRLSATASEGPADQATENGRGSASENERSSGGGNDRGPADENGRGSGGGNDPGPASGSDRGSGGGDGRSPDQSGAHGDVGSEGGPDRDAGSEGGSRGDADSAHVPGGGEDLHSDSERGVECRLGDNPKGSSA